jgi:hypothetical protein
MPQGAREELAQDGRENRDRLAILIGLGSPHQRSVKSMFLELSLLILLAPEWLDAGREDYVVCHERV